MTSLGEQFPIEQERVREVLRSLMPGPLTYDYLRRLTIRMMKGISGT